MKIYEIWEQIKNESIDIKYIVLASLNAQLKIRFEQIVDQEVMKCGVIVGKNLVVDYLELRFSSEEDLHDLGLDKHSDLMLYRDLIFLVDDVVACTDTDLGNEAEEIDIEACLSNSGSRAQPVLDLLSNVLGQVYESEYIDISDSTLSNLKQDRKCA